MKKHVVIIGGGVSGLATANILVRKGFAVTILEAKDRLGGRIHTIHEGTLPIELGAEFLHGENKAVRAIINAAKLTTHLVPLDQLVMHNGRLKRVKVWDKMANIINRIDPHKTDTTFKKFLATQRLRPFDRRLAIAYAQGFHASHIDRIGVHSIRRGEYSAEHMEGDSQSRINEGYSAMVGFLEREIRKHGGKILTGAVVKTVQWKPNQVNITFRHNAKPRRIEANAAIVTVSLGILKAKTIRFTPALQEKQDAIDQLYFGNVIKIVMVFQERWWPKNFTFIQSMDEPIPVCWTDPRGNVLTGWSGGPKADALKRLSKAALQKLALKTLTRIFPKFAPVIKKQLLTTHSHNWACDPHVRGAYSYIPVNGLDLPKLLAAPVGDTLFFAGEATTDDAQPGTVFGAYESGLRAAREVIKFCMR